MAEVHLDPARRLSKGHAVARLIIGSCLMLFTLLLFGAWAFGSFRGMALFFAMRSRMVIDPPEIVLQAEPDNVVQRAHFTLTNVTGRTVRLLGSQARCPCEIEGRLPELLRQGESVQVSVQIRTSGIDVPSFEDTVELFTDYSERPIVRVPVRGRIRK